MSETPQEQPQEIASEPTESEVIPELSEKEQDQLTKATIATEDLVRSIEILQERGMTAKEIKEVMAKFMQFES